MKLLINHEVSISETFNPSITDEERQGVYEYLESISKDLKEYIVYHRVENNESGVRFTLEVQKVVLDEIQMNHVFSILNEFMNINIEYVQLGGKGCDFAMEITNK